MKYKRSYAVAGIIILAAVVFYHISNKPNYTENVSNNSSSPEVISGTSIPEVSKPNAKALEELLDNISVINDDTINDFKYLQHKFRKSINLDDHLEKVKEYLFSSYDPEYAEKIFETYKVWLECEMAVAVEFGDLPSAGSPQEIEALLKAIHEFRKNSLGENLADTLYGFDLKKKIYNLNRSTIVNNNELYGREKEKLIEELELEYPDIDTYSAVPYNNYQDKLKLYQRDLNEADSIEDKKEIINQLRKATLPPETVEKLESIDSSVQKNKEKEELYKSRKKTIVSDTNLSSDEKKNLLNDLKIEMFGPKGAEAKTRIENLEKGYQKIVSRLNSQD